MTLTRLFLLLTTALTLGVACPSAGAAEKKEVYYLGEAELSSGEGRPMGSQVILLRKSHDPEAGEVVEAAVIVQPDGRVEESVITFDVATGDTNNEFAVSSGDGTIEGEGTFAGPAWDWNYFKATYRSANGVVIEDQNTLTDDSVVTARKTITLPNGRVYMTMDVTLKAVTPSTYRILKPVLLKRAASDDRGEPTRSDDAGK